MLEVARGRRSAVGELLPRARSCSVVVRVGGRPRTAVVPGSPSSVRRVVRSGRAGRSSRSPGRGRSSCSRAPKAGSSVMSASQLPAAGRPMSRLPADEPGRPDASEQAGGAHALERRRDDRGRARAVGHRVEGLEPVAGVVDDGLDRRCRARRPRRACAAPRRSPRRPSRRRRRWCGASSRMPSRISSSSTAAIAPPVERTASSAYGPSAGLPMFSDLAMPVGLDRLHDVPAVVERGGDRRAAGRLRAEHPPRRASAPARPRPAP